MGEVYLAEDTKLYRKVALKFLPSHLCQDDDCRARFKREAQAVAKLNHPNVIHIYEVSEYQGRPFFAMELAEGQSLRDLANGKDTSVDRIIELAIQICDGLCAAHDKKIVHRDIKPSNIVIDGHGRPKILDFGLAAIQGGEQLTKTGSTLGTIRYMSPEQIEGREVDRRSDLFSFGVVLYELIAGRTPFESGNEAATLKAIAQGNPEPLARYKSEVPEELQRTVSKLLEKEASLRYQSANDVLADFRRLKVQSGEVPAAKAEKGDWRRMLVVLPFQNLGPSDEEYFADGMTEEIISRLSAIGGLGVISRTSAWTYKGSSRSIREISADLGVDFVMEGSVRWNRRDKDPDRVRITFQLIRTSDDTHLWSDRVDRTLDDIFEVQSQIAEQVVKQLDIRLRKPERQILNAKPTDNLDAYKAYLQGLDFVGRPDYAEADFHAAIRQFEIAVELDSDFALAYANLSRTHSHIYFHGYDRSAERIGKSRKAVDKAYNLQPSLAEVHLAYGYHYYYCLEDYERALSELDKARREHPNDARILALSASIVKRRGRIDEAAQLYERAFELSPRDASLPHEIGCAYMTARKYQEAQQFYELSIALSPDQVLAYVCKAWNYWLWKADLKSGIETTFEIPPDAERTTFYLYRAKLFAREYADAITILSNAPVVFDEGQWLRSPKALYAAYAHQRLGNKAEAEENYRTALEILRAEVEKRPDDDRLHSALGITYAGLGWTDEAVKSAELAVELLPVKKNAVVGPFRIEDLAMVHTMLGNPKAAIEQLTYLLSIPCWLSGPVLRIDPRWDPLRDDRSFQNLMDGRQPQ
jgi:serine/threonine-protein kinase